MLQLALRAKSEGMLRRLLLMLILVLTCTAVPFAQTGPGPQEVAFQSGALQLHVFLWKPDGNGPFPAILWNHGSEKLPGSRPELGKFYTEHGYVFFIPHRRGQGRSPGTYIQGQIEAAPPASRTSVQIATLEAQVDDVLAALSYLETQPFVNADRVAMSGCSYGGIETLLMGERKPHVTALIPFAPGAESWQSNPRLRDRLVRAVNAAAAPIFLIQAQNDYDLGPSNVLTPAVLKHGPPSKGNVYPPFGTAPAEGHAGFCMTATAVWGSDVLDFLAAVKS